MPTGSRRRSRRRPTSTTSTRAAARPAATSRTRRSPQAFYNKEEGVTRLATETGAGQWGSALAFAGRGLRARGQGLHGPRELRPEAVPPDPDGDLRRAGRRQPEPRHGVRPQASSARHPDNTGSLGIAISEAIEDTVTHPGTKYSLGSVFDFVLLHQTVIGQESIEQMAMAGEEPDVIIGCAGGGSNFAGLTFPWLGRTFRDGREVPGHRRRARGGAEPDPRRLRLRLRRHREDDAAGQDAHARPRLHPRADPRRRPALPRHVAAGQPAQGARLDRGAERPPAGDASRPASSSPGPRASCRRPSRRTRSRSRSTRRSPRGRRASRG